MRPYTDYQAFSQEFASLIESLRFTEDPVEEEQLVTDLTTMQTVNPLFADKFLMIADVSETIRLIELGLIKDQADRFVDFYAQDGYFNEKGY